jgi:hypothetical protein
MAAVTMKISVFWVVMLCGLETAQHFGGTYCLHLQDRRVSQARNRQRSRQVAVFSSKMSGSLQTIWHYNPDDSTLQEFILADFFFYSVTCKTFRIMSLLNWFS